MKEFKRWWKNKFSSRKGNDNSYLGYPEAHQAWRAALECVQDIACKGGILQNDFVIRKWIREELEK